MSRRRAAATRIALSNSSSARACHLFNHLDVATLRRCLAPPSRAVLRLPPSVRRRYAAAACAPTTASASVSRSRFLSRPRP